MNRIAILIATGAAIAALARPAQAENVDENPSESSGDRQPVVEVRHEVSWTAVEVRTESSWVATDEAVRLREGAAVVRPRLVLPGDFGAWAYAPPQFGPTPVAVTAAEGALTSHVSVIAEGAEDTIDHRFSGAAAGLRLHLLPREGPLQLSLTSGVGRDLTSNVAGDLKGGEPKLWNQIQASYDVGRWHFAGAVRARAPSSDPWNQMSTSGSVGVSVDLGPARVGVEYAADQYATDQGMVTRAAFIPWVGVPLANGNGMLRLAGVVPTIGNEGVSLRLALAINF